MSSTKALTPKEIDTLDRLTAATRIIATPGISLREAIGQFQDEHPQDTEAEARKWINKAKEYINSGYPVDLELAKRQYAANLEWLIVTLRRKLVVDDIETTVIEDQGAEEAAKEGEQATASPRRVKTRTKRGVINANVGNLLLKTMKEHATVTGARPKEVRVSLTQNNLNMGAGTFSELSNEELLKEIGLSNAKVLPGAVGADDQSVQARGGEVVVLAEGEAGGG